MKMVTKHSMMFGTFLAVAIAAAPAEAGQTVAPRAAAAVQAVQVPPAPPVQPVPTVVAPTPAVPPVEPFVFTMPQLPALAPMPAIPPVDTFVYTMPAMPALAPMPDMQMVWTEAAQGARVAIAGREQSADDLYERARDLIEQSRYDRALADLDRIIALNKDRLDAALYWKAYSLAKLGQRTEALTAVGDLEKRFKDSGWAKSAKALELELREASGQTVSPESQLDDEMKILALRTLMQNDPDRALPMVEKILSGNGSPKVKDQALFVLSQSRQAKAREILANIAKTGNPDLQLRAIRYLGVMGIAENRQLLDEVYRSSSDPAVKRAILRSFMTSGDRARLLGLAKGEKDEKLRIEAIRQLGAMRAPELAELYSSEASPEIKKQIINGLFIGGQQDKLIELAKTERDPEIQKTAVRQLGMMRRTDTSAALTSIYASSTNADVRKAVVNALFTQGNAGALVTLARAEKSPEMRKEIVSRLSMMKSKEATDYMLEILGK
jgi:tetratricopeptide (TPR) repeat protein